MKLRWAWLAEAQHWQALDAPQLAAGLGCWHGCGSPNQALVQGQLLERQPQEQVFQPQVRRQAQLSWAVARQAQARFGSQARFAQARLQRCCQPCEPPWQPHCCHFDFWARHARGRTNSPARPNPTPEDQRSTDLGHRAHWQKQAGRQRPSARQAAVPASVNQIVVFSSWT